MIKFHEKGIDVIKQSFAGADKGIICTPYYTERGLRLVDSFFDVAEEIEFWTRFSPLDWRAGVADMAALKQRVQYIKDRKKKITLHVSDDLHAKIYSFSNNKVIIGSANLTWPAMTTNIETICELTKADAANFQPFMEIFRSRLTPLPVDVFMDYVAISADAISKPSEGPAEEDGDMNAAIDLAESMFRKSLVQTARKAPSIPSFEIEKFLEYCRVDKTVVSREIVDRCEGKYNLQGHVKHCYYGTVQFLLENHKFISEIAAIPGKSLYDFSNPSIRSQWRDFLHDHAREIDKKRDFSFRTLRVYLPPSLGGICTGGGGGSGTLKRVFPVVARMLRESGKKK
jgi:hypothetical protein